MSFVHLHSHTVYSIKDSSNHIKDYVAKVKALGMNAAAITDHGVMYGCLSFYKEMKNAGLNPILGCEVYVSKKSRLVKNASNRKYNHLILLARNNTGYENLTKICSQGWIDGFYYKPRIDHEVLEMYHDGMIALSACVAGEIPEAVLSGDMDKAEELLNYYVDLFGKDNFFLEMQDHGLAEEQTVNAGLLALHQKTGVELVATNDCHYTNREDSEAHDVLICLQQEKKLSDSNRMKYKEGAFYVKSEKEMRTLFHFIQEAIDNSQKIADRCHVELTFHETKMPVFPVPDGHTTYSYLEKLCHQGLRERYPMDNGSVRKQLEYELSVIRKMGYVEYFLIVWDYINYCRENAIPVGPGRGSAAGSVVSYCLHITDIDPIKYSLLFERFLNPERVSMPDIDVDFCYVRRQEVIDHVRELYGEANVVQIVTFGTMAARAVIKDVGRVLDYSYEVCDRLSKMIPEELNITIEKALEQNPELKLQYESDASIARLIDMAKKLEGVPKSTSMHAAGVVVCPKPAQELIPVACSTDGMLVSQYNMVEVEELGLLKMDFLGLRTLTVIRDAIKNIETNHGIKIDLNHLDYDDKEVFEFISSGKTSGVFQLESDGMKNFTKELHPNSLEDMIAGISLYRPGPMDFIPQYIAGKNDQKNVKYLCPQLKPILEPTYGCIVYQEQVMQIFQSLAGYTLGQSDEIRRAMSKKKQYVIDAERSTFVSGDNARNIPGCIKNGIDEKIANKIYDSMVDFAKYAFNKSHAACYAVISYQTAWIKYYYPLEFWAATMTSVVSNSKKLTSYMNAAKTENIHICCPDINRSKDRFVADHGKILYALCGIKKVGIDVTRNLVEYRERNGSFRDFREAIEELQEVGFNKGQIENMILAGAFDSFGGFRTQYLGIYESIMDAAAADKKKNISGQMSLFEDGMLEEIKATILPEIPEFSKKELLKKEKEVLNVYVSGHPLEDDLSIIKKYSSIKSLDFGDASGDEDEGGEYISHVKNGQEVSVVCLIKGMRRTYTKKDKKPMAFLFVEDLYGPIDNVVVFPAIYERVYPFLKEDAKIIIKGQISMEDGKSPSIMVEDVLSIDIMLKKVWIQFDSIDAFEKAFPQMDAYRCGGRDDLIVYIRENKSKREWKSSLTLDDFILKELQSKFGKRNVAVTA